MRSVQCRLQGGEHRHGFFLSRTLFFRRRHLAGAQTTQHLLPRHRLRRDVVAHDAYEVEFALLRVAVVTVSAMCADKVAH
jgi:hypothetical protein